MNTVEKVRKYCYETLELAKEKYTNKRIGARNRDDELGAQFYEGMLHSTEALQTDLKWIVGNGVFEESKYNYCKSHHTEYINLPKDIRNYIDTLDIKNPETKMFDVDVYYDIDVRNHWEK